MQKLTDEKIELLIDYVKVIPGLYDKKEKHYKNTDWREKQWKGIANKLDVDEQDAKKAWRSLRDQFMKCLKETKGTTGQEAQDMNNRKKYKYFQHLLFLKDSVEPRRTSCNFDDTNQENIEEMAFEECGSQDGFWREIDSMSMCETSHQQQTVPVPQLSPLSDIYSTPGSSASTSGSSKRKKKQKIMKTHFKNF